MSADPAREIAWCEFGRNTSGPITEDTYDAFCAGWDAAVASRDLKRDLHSTTAGQADRAAAATVRKAAAIRVTACEPDRPFGFSPARGPQGTAPGVH